jgi:OmcA/MtrC family decaheme c-type cytochrome
MRISPSAFGVGRYLAGLVLVAGSLVLFSAPKRPEITRHDKAYYADPNVVDFVRPGLNISIVSSQIASDGTISVHYQLTDPKGLPLDQAGIQTPGAISVSFLCAYIPQGQTQFVDYVTRPQTSPITKNTAAQAGADSGGTTQTLAMGDYVYTFKQKAVPPTGSYDPTATHRMGIYGSRNLTEFDLGTNYASLTSDFVPNGSKVTVTRDVVRTASCNKCHDTLSAHGGSRQGLDLCIMCHTPQTIDPDTGNTLDAKVWIHKLHMGSQLPSVQAGTPYQIIGHAQALSDWSSVVLPSDPRRCAFCHETTTGAAQANAWYTNPNRAACGSCHDNVNFATGLNHVNLPQVNDNQCSTCHIPKGELEFDASIMGAHTVPTQSATAPGVNVTLVKVDNGTAGKTPTVTFTIRDNSGAAIPMSAMTGGSNRLALVMAGPTSDYGYTSFGKDVATPGYVSENPVQNAPCSNDGTCTYTFTHAIPAAATGTYAIGIEARRGLTLLPGTTQQQTTEYGAINKVIYFSVDGSPIVPRRQVVDVAKCNGCHSYLSLHGENRNQIEMCVLCHNPSENDVSQRPNAVVAADKALPPQSVNFALMIHKIHTGAEMAANFGTDYTIVGYGGSHNNFGTTFASVPASITNTGVRYPAMGPTGSTGDTANCEMCHVNNSETVFPIGKNAVADTQGKLNPAPATTSACTACHQNTSALAHSVAQTDPKFGESCDVCHASGASFDVQKMHAGQ